MLSAMPVITLPVGRTSLVQKIVVGNFDSFEPVQFRSGRILDPCQPDRVKALQPVRHSQTIWDPAGRWADVETYLTWSEVLREEVQQVFEQWKQHLLHVCLVDTDMMSLLQSTFKNLGPFRRPVYINAITIEDDTFIR